MNLSINKNGVEHTAANRGVYAMRADGRKSGHISLTQLYLLADEVLKGSTQKVGSCFQKTIRIRLMQG